MRVLPLLDSSCVLIDHRKAFYDVVDYLIKKARKIFYAQLETRTSLLSLKGKKDTEKLLKKMDFSLEKRMS